MQKRSIVEEAWGAESGRGGSGQACAEPNWNVLEAYLRLLLVQSPGDRSRQLQVWKRRLPGLATQIAQLVAEELEDETFLIAPD